MMTYWAQSVDDDCEFYMFWSEAKRDEFVRLHCAESWKFGRLVNGVEITDGWA